MSIIIGYFKLSNHKNSGKVGYNDELLALKENVITPRPKPKPLPRKLVDHDSHLASHDVLLVLSSSAFLLGSYYPDKLSLQVLPTLGPKVHKRVEGLGFGYLLLAVFRPVEPGLGVGSVKGCLGFWNVKCSGV